MKIMFVSGNMGKYKEVKEVLQRYGVEVSHVKKDKPEIDSDDLRKIATYAAKKLSAELKQVVLVEDTGLYFEAFNNFPGTRPKFVYKGIGLRGVLKLLDGENRSAYFMTIAALGWPDGKVQLFEGKVEGRIASKAQGIPDEHLPYNALFVPEGFDKTFAEMPEVKAKISQRVRAFEKVGEYLKGECNGKQV